MMNLFLYYWKIQSLYCQSQNSPCSLRCFFTLDLFNENPNFNTQIKKEDQRNAKIRNQIVLYEHEGMSNYGSNENVAATTPTPTSLCLIEDRRGHDLQICTMKLEYAIKKQK